MWTRLITTRHPRGSLLVDHFQGSKRLFLTATPLYQGKRILPYLHVLI